MKRIEYCHGCKQQKVRKSRYFRTFLHLHYEPGESIYIPAGACYIRLAKQNRGQTASKLRAWCRLVTPDVSRAVPHSPFANQRSVCALERRKRAQRIRGFALSGDSFRRGRFRRTSGGPFFSVLPEKNGEKRGAGYVWCILRVQFRRVLIFGCYEHTYSPYGRYGTRRLLRYNRFVSSCDLISAVKTPCIQNLQGSANLPESCRGRCPSSALRAARCAVAPRN